MQKQNEEAEVSITPLIDMVFILLIFFLVTASYVSQTGITINKPVAATAQELDQDALVIGMDAAGYIYISGRQIDKFSLEQIIGDKLAENTNLGVVLQVDKEVSAEAIVDIMDRVKGLGVERFALGADKTTTH
jgi:biopolymer transport protein ExbD